MKRAKWTIIVLAMTLLISGCETFTLRSSPEAFRTGRVLEEGEYRVVTNSILLLTMPMPGLIWRVSRGFPMDWEVTAGWGVHALVVDSAENEDESDVYQGPEIFVSKNLINYNDKFYLAATAGTEMNILPVFDAAFITGVNFGWYPVEWFTIFGHTNVLFHTEGYFSPQAGLGLGIDGPFVLKAAAYSHFKEESVELSDGSLFWPLYYGIQIGFTF